jgi:hypothetical protein
MKKSASKIRLLLTLIVLSGSLASCWAPRCPMETCRSKYEHNHNTLVSGVFSPRYGIPYKLHFFWDQNKGDENPDTEFVPGSSNGKKKKSKKRYPWEKW